MKFTTVILALAIVCANARRPSEVWTSEQEDAAGIVKNNAKKYTIITWIKIRHSFINNVPSINV